MPLLALAGTALSWIGRIGLLAFGVNETQKFLQANKAYITNSASAAQQGGMTDDEQKKLVAATTYDQVEQSGGSPDDFWAGLSATEKEALKFSPETLRSDMGRTKFLGLSSALLFAGALAAGGYGALKGIPILLSTLAKLRDARTAGATALELMTIIEEGKIAGIAAVWVPGLIAGIASAGGWLTASMTNNLNDASLWGRIFLGQAADDFEKLKAKGGGASGTGTGGGSSLSEPRTIIRIVEDKKPEHFIGTLFSAKLGSADSFERFIDDEITDMQDLKEDVKLNLNKWLGSLPARMGYSVGVRKDPVDEYGAQQSGVWATLTIYVTHLSGKFSPIDTILLGPIAPKARLVLQKEQKTIETEIKNFVSAATVTEIQVPGGAVDVFKGDGTHASLSDILAPTVGGSETAAGTGTGSPSSSSTTTPNDKTKSKAELERELEAIIAKAKALGIDTSAQEKMLAESRGTTTSTAAPTAAPTPTLPAGFESGAKLTVNTPGSTLNVRSTASLNGRVIASLTNGSIVTSQGDFKAADGHLWLKVKFSVPERSGNGWVASNFLIRASKSSGGGSGGGGGGSW